MKTKIRVLPVVSLLLLVSLFGISGKSAAQDGDVKKTNCENPGVINAKPENIASNISYEKYQSILTYFNNPKNRVMIQFPGEKTQYLWQNMSLLFPTAQVPRNGAIVNLSYDIQKSISAVTYKNSKGETYSVDGHFEKFPIDAMIVMKNGKVVYERYKTMRSEDKHIWYSVSKIIGSTLMLFLEEEGKVDVNNPVTCYLPELKGTIWDGVKVIEALDMATGLNGTELDEPNNDAMTNPEQIWYQWAISVGMTARTTADTAKWYDVLGKMIRIRPAYDAFAYNSISTFVVDRIVERAGNKPLTVQMSERVWSKMGMEHDGYMATSPTGFCLGNGFMNSTLRDLARYGLIYTPSHSKISGETIITPQMLAKMQNMEHSDMYSKGSVGKFYVSAYPEEKVLANRYQWDVVFQDGDMFKSGIGGQGLYVSPGKDVVVAWFCTGNGDNQEEVMARSIAKYLK